MWMAADYIRPVWLDRQHIDDVNFPGEPGLILTCGAAGLLSGEKSLAVALRRLSWIARDRGRPGSVRA